MGAVENVKEVADLIRKFNDIELNRRILKLEEEVMDLTRDKRRSQDRVAELEHALKFSKELEFRDKFYWASGDPHPYCPACWDKNRQAIHLTDTRLPGYGDHKQCPVCKHSYGRRFG